MNHAKSAREAIDRLVEARRECLEQIAGGLIHHQTTKQLIELQTAIEVAERAAQHEHSMMRLREVGSS